MSILDWGWRFHIYFVKLCRLGYFFHAESIFWWYQAEKWTQNPRWRHFGRHLGFFAILNCFDSFLRLVPPKIRFSMKKYPYARSFTKYISKLHPQLNYEYNSLSIFKKPIVIQMYQSSIKDIVLTPPPPLQNKTITDFVYVP